MHIEIAERLKPLSHEPGTFFILPGTNFRVQVFPACFKINDLSTNDCTPVAQVTMHLQGPIKQFTAEQDLERGMVRVWGMSEQGFCRYNLKAAADGSNVMLAIEKAPQQGISFQCSGLCSMDDERPLQAHEQRLISLGSQTKLAPYQITPVDRLSLGNHKAQDWQLMRRRRNFAEIFPIWHRLGQLIPHQRVDSNAGTLGLLDECQRAIAASSPEHILSHFEKLFLAGFEGGLSPRLIDSDFQGILANNDPITNDSPLPLLSRGTELIRSLFVQYDENSIALLPACPPEFHCGRLIDFVCGTLGTLHIEWTKKALRQMIFIASSTQEIRIKAHDGQSQCRVRQSSKDRGRIYKLDSLLPIISGQAYWLDNFMS